MSAESPFKPHYGTTQVITPVTAASSVTLNKIDKSVRIVNTHATSGFFFKISTAADITVNPATSADCYIRPTSSMIVEKADGWDTLSVIRSVADGTGFAMTGEGGIGQA